MEQRQIPFTVKKTSGIPWNRDIINEMTKRMGYSVKTPAYRMLTKPEYSAMRALLASLAQQQLEEVLTLIPDKTMQALKESLDNLPEDKILKIKAWEIIEGIDFDKETFEEILHKVQDALNLLMDAWELNQPKKQVEAKWAGNENCVGPICSDPGVSTFKQDKTCWDKSCIGCECKGDAPVINQQINQKKPAPPVKDNPELKLEFFPGGLRYMRTSAQGQRILFFTKRGVSIKTWIDGCHYSSFEINEPTMRFEFQWSQESGVSYGKIKLITNTSSYELDDRFDKNSFDKIKTWAASVNNTRDNND